MKCHYTAVKIAKIKNNDNVKRWQGCREIESLVAGGGFKIENHSGKQFGSPSNN